MLCARVMRGTSSIANTVTLRRASSATASGAARGLASPMTSWSGRSRSRSGRPASGLAGKVRTWRTMSAPKASAREPTSAPFSL